MPRRSLDIWCELAQNFDHFKPDFLVKYGSSEMWYHTLESRVSSDIQTSPSLLKNSALVSFFQLTSWCLDIW